VATLHDTLHFCRYSFSSIFSKTQKMSFAKTNEKKKQIGAAHQKCVGFGPFFIAGVSQIGLSRLIC
jgi:hypothetical protein